MSQEQVILLALKLVLVLNEVAIIAFILIYSRLAVWWKNTIGRSIVIIDALLGLALLPSIISLFWHFSRLTSYVAAWIDIGIFTAIAVTMIQRCVMWVRISKTGEEDADDAERGRLRRFWRRAFGTPRVHDDPSS